MNAVYRYLFCVFCTVVLCGIIRMLFPGEKNSLMKLVTGLAVTVVTLSPVLTGQKISLDTYFDQYVIDSDFAVQEGILSARQSLSEFIKTKSETYILNKAAGMGAHVSVDVVLSDTDLPAPVQITVCGMVSPYIKEQLSECIWHELGIAEDEQIWIS